MRCAIEASYLLQAEKTGVQYYSQGLVQGLAELPETPQITLFFPRRPAPGDLPAPAERAVAEKRMKVTSLHMPRLWLRLGVPALVASGRVQVCHFPGTIVPRFLGAQPVVTVHDLCWIHYPHSYPPRELQLLWNVVVRSVRRAAAVLTHSEQTKQDCLDVLRLDESRVFAVPLAPRSNLGPPQSDRDEIRRSLGFDRPYVLSVGTICRRKNQLRLVAALDLLRQRSKLDFTLVLAGSHGLGADEVLQLRSDLSLEDDIQIREYVSEPALTRLYQGAEMLAFPSLCEGFGLPVVEAMACGTPVLTSDVGALREAGGDAAEYCDPKEPESIADGLLRLMGNPSRRADLTRAGLERAKGFTWKATAERTLQAYRLAATAVS